MGSAGAVTCWGGFLLDPPGPNYLRPLPLPATPPAELKGHPSNNPHRLRPAEYWSCSPSPQILRGRSEHPSGAGARWKRNVRAFLRSLRRLVRQLPDPAQDFRPPATVRECRGTRSHRLHLCRRCSEVWDSGETASERIFCKPCILQDGRASTIFKAVDDTVPAVSCRSIKARGKLEFVSLVDLTHPLSSPPSPPCPLHSFREPVCHIIGVGGVDPLDFSCRVSGPGRTQSEDCDLYSLRFGTPPAPPTCFRGLAVSVFSPTRLPNLPRCR